MIYIKDYSSPLALTEEKQSAVRSQFADFIGKMIVVYIGYTSFTGILIEVLSDSIKLITSLPAPPALPQKARGSQRNTCGNNRKCGRPGTNAFIRIDSITAFEYYSL